MQCQYCGGQVQFDFCLRCGALIRIPIAKPPTSQASNSPLDDLKARVKKWFQGLDTGTKIAYALVGALIILSPIAFLFDAATTSNKPQPPVALKSSASSSSTASTPPAVVISPAERLKTAKHFLEDDRTLGALYTARSELTGIQSSDQEYAEAQKMLKEIEPEIARKEKKADAEDKARRVTEAPALREQLADNYVSVISAANPYLNFIKKKTTKAKGGYALWAVHDLFTSSSFSMGNDAGIVQAWINENSADLHRANIVRVGFMNSSGYLGYCYFDLK